MMALDAANEGWPMMSSGYFVGTENYVLSIRQDRKREDVGGRKPVSQQCKEKKFSRDVNTAARLALSSL